MSVQCVLCYRGWCDNDYRDREIGAIMKTERARGVCVNCGQAIELLDPDENMWLHIGTRKMRCELYATPARLP